MEVPLSTLICTVIIQHIPLLQLIKFGQEIFRSQHATSGLYVYFVNQPSDTVAQQSLQIITSVPMLAHAQLTQLNATQCNSHTSDNTVIHPVYHSRNLLQLNGTLLTSRNLPSKIVAYACPFLLSEKLINLVPDNVLL